MAASALDYPAAQNVERLRTLARRCRELSEMTTVPDVVRELLSIATELEGEAERAERR